MFNNIYKNKTVIVTGHSGFKGSWLSIWLSTLGAKVIGVSNGIPSTPSNYIVSKVNDTLDDHRIDIRDTDSIKNLFKKSKPDFVFHLAAQSLVMPSYESPIDTFSTNALGTVSVLDALRTLNNKVVAVMITSDKAYDNVEWSWGYRETDRIGGKDPYSASKGMAELAIKSYVESFFSKPESNVTLGITRAGNVIGGGDWATNRIVADCMKAWSKNQIVDIRSPNATRPWQHVLEPLSGYLQLGQNLANHKKNHGQAYNFGPPANQNYTVRELINEMSNSWGNIRWNDSSKDSKHLSEAGLLKLNCDKALLDLNWEANLNFEQTVKMTVAWYKEFYENNQTSMSDYTISQISSYEGIAMNNGFSWTI